MLLAMQRGIQPPPGVVSLQAATMFASLILKLIWCNGNLQCPHAPRGKLLLSISLLRWFRLFELPFFKNLQLSQLIVRTLCLTIKHMLSSCANELNNTGCHRSLTNLEYHFHKHFQTCFSPDFHAMLHDLRLASPSNFILEYP